MQLLSKVFILFLLDKDERGWYTGCYRVRVGASAWAWSLR